jgi:hypothetical protein
LVIYSLCIPLAIFLGYLLASPAPLSDRTTYYGVGAVFSLLLLPLLLKHHHPALILTWNTTVVIFFLTGTPNIWMVLAMLGFTITLLQYILARQSLQATVPSVTRPLIAFGIVVVATALLTGGVGFKALGSDVGGGKRYVGIVAAILGYFAISMRRIPLSQATFYTGLYFLGGVTLAIGSLAPYLPSGFTFIFWFFPVDSGYFYTFNPEAHNLSVARLTGVAQAAMFGMYFMLARYGIRGMISSGRPWRFALFLAIWAISLIGGYRSFMLATALLFVVQFYLERLHRTNWLAIFGVTAFTVFTLSLPFATHLPYSFQRALSVFKVPVSPEVEMDTRNSNEWRLRMWAQVTPQIPQYLLLGKGMGINVRETMMAFDDVFTRRAVDNTEAATASQDYHNGPLSVIIPLGIFGVITLVWLWYAGYRLLLANHRYGDPNLQNINTLLLALYLTKIAHFLFIFGSLHLDFYQFTGILALSIALNGGMAKKPAVAPADKSPKPRTTPTILPHAKPAFGR